MKKEYITLIKQLISEIEGAPYPSQINNGLYTIWYEHAIMVATNALGKIVDQLELDKNKKII